MCPLLFITFDSHQKIFKPNNGPNLAGDFHNFNSCRLGGMCFIEMVAHYHQSYNDSPRIFHINTAIITFTCVNYITRFEDALLLFFFQVKCSKWFHRSQHFCSLWLFLVWSLKPKDIGNMHITKKKCSWLLSKVQKCK